MTRTASRLAAFAAATFASLALAQTPAPAPATAAAQCTDCGVVQSVRFVEVKGQSSGVGMVAGGVLGGVLGHQIGSGRGNTVATIAGAAGGAYVGNEVEKNKNTKGSVERRHQDGQRPAADLRLHAASRRCTTATA